MKTPWYESTPGALDNLLLANQFVYCDLYTITTKLGPILRLATGDIDVNIGGTSWVHNGPRINDMDNKATAHWKIGLDIDTWTVYISPRSYDPVTGDPWPDKIGSEPFTAAVVAGYLDGAQVQVDRAYFPAWPDMSQNFFPLSLIPVAALTIFFGEVAEIDDGGRSGFILNINSHLQLLNISMPRDLYQAGCRHTLFDTGCKLSAAAFMETGTLSSGSTRNTLLSSIAAPGGSGTYQLGRLKMTSGRNAGFSRMVRRWTAGSPGTFSLITPLPFPVNAGETFEAYPGCDKAEATCTAFGNHVNFGGFPYIPAPETAY